MLWVEIAHVTNNLVTEVAYLLNLCYRKAFKPRDIINRCYNRFAASYHHLHHAAGITAPRLCRRSW